MQSIAILTPRAPASPRASTRHRALLAAGLLAAAALTACGDASAPLPSEARGGQRSKTASPPTSGDAVVRGQVLGVDSANGQPWHAHPLGGAKVTAIHVWKDPAAGPDTSRAPAVLTTIGTTTTGGDGSFELRGVPSGYFFLDVVPPASSGFRSGRAGSVSFPQGSTEGAFVYLYPYP